MSTELNSKIGAESVLMGEGTCGSVPVSADESGGPTTQASKEAESVFGSNAVEYEASVVGSSPPSTDGAIHSGSRARAVTGVVS